MDNICSKLINVCAADRLSLFDVCGDMCVYTNKRQGEKMNEDNFKNVYVIFTKLFSK